MHVAIIGGGGTIGSTVAYTLATLERAWDVTLVDVDADHTKGHAIDITHARTVGQLPRLDGRPIGEGEIRARPSEAGSLVDVDCAIVTASRAPPAGAKERGGRIKFLERNRELAESLGTLFVDHGPMPVVVASNPVDVMTYLLWQSTGWDRHRFVGYSLSDAARVADEIARILDCRPNEVYCPVLGEHGEHLVPVFSRLTVAGERATLDEDDRKRVRAYAIDVPYEVIELRGGRDTSRWVTGQGLAQLVRSMLLEEAAAPLGLSVPLEGEYGFRDICLSVPIRLSARGWTDIVEWDLASDERARLQAAHDAIRSRLSNRRGE